MTPIVLALLALSCLFSVIYAREISCAADPSNLFFNIQCDHTTTESYGGATSYDICWVKILYCDEGDDTEINYPLNTSYVEAIAPYAISAKIVPADLADPDFDDYAIYAKVCENPVISLNNLLELSNTIDVTTLTRIGPSDLADWYGLNGATSRLQQDPYCHCPESDQIVTSPFHPCSGHEKQLQIFTKQTSNGAVDVCQWDRDWRDEFGQCRNKEIALYFGFDANKESMCDGGGEGGLQSVFGDTQRRRRRRSRRRLPYINGTYSGPNAPCLTLEITLETENLLPSNNDPDPAANIYLIGQALGGGSNGVIVMPDIIDPELDDVSQGDEDDESVWEVDEECMDMTQIQDSYFQSDTVSPDLTGNATVLSDGFTLTVPYETPESILYLFEISALPFTISHSCSNAIGFFAEIYEDGELLGESEVISIPPNEAGVARQKKLLFNESVLLNPDTSFEIIFSGLYYGNNCGLSEISVGDGDGRRRLVDENGFFDYEDFEADANPNSCILGAGLAQSASMKTAVNTICNEGLANFEEIETGFFRQHGSNALANHVVMSGSLEVYDENGELKFQTNDWPADDIKNPCIAIDEQNLRVYAIGGYSETTGRAVADIQVFQFYDDELENGTSVTELLGWKLDKARYGSMCLFWRKDDDSEHLIVVSGMEDPADELKNKKTFFNDIRVFPVPANRDQLVDIWTGMTSSEPSSGNSYLGKSGLLDARLLLFENQYLYFFGGKTHVASKQFVQVFDLNLISVAGDGDMFALDTMSLTQDKALPVVDITALTDGSVTRTCYMIFAGQSYAGNKVFGDVSSDNLQLFCNPLMGDVSQPEIVSRRLGEGDDVVTLSEFDKYMFQKGKTQRRLVTGEEESEVLIRDYDYRLDGIWYDFDVTVNLCYADNSELEEAEIYYTDLDIAALAGIGEDILTTSEEAYLGWSNGFGAVNVFDVEIVAVNYATSDPTADPTSEPTTSEPTTSAPTTTAAPTTSEPTTAEPTTSEPTTTSAPTTSEPTTSAPTTAEPTTSDCECISTCAGLSNGDYPSCNSCHVYATCSNGILYDDRPCAAATPALVWDDNLKSCAAESSCSEDPCDP